MTDLIKLDEDLYYNMETGDIYKHKTYKYLTYLDNDGYNRIRYKNNAIRIHTLIHDKLKIDRTGLVVTFLDGNKQNTSMHNMALMTRHECNLHHYWLRKLAKYKNGS